MHKLVFSLIALVSASPALANEYDRYTAICKVSGTEQTSVRNGSLVDLEWLPVSDRLEGAEVTFEQQGGETPYTYTATGLSLDANHIRFVLGSARTGDFTLRVIGRGHAGVAACEGFATCEANIIEELQLPIAIAE